MIRSRQTASLLLAAALTTFASSATFAGYAMPAPETGPENSANWYIGLFGGGVMMQNLRGSDGVDTISTRFKTTYDEGLAFGYRASTFRFEGQYTFVDSHVNRYKNLVTGTETTPNQPDRLKAHILLANMYYDFQGQSDAWGYYVGLGVGGAKLTRKARLSSSCNSCSASTLNLPVSGGTIVTDFKADENKLAFQGMFGVTYSTDYHFVYDLGLRYLSTAKLSKIGNKQLALAIFNLGLTYQVPV